MKKSIILLFVASIAACAKSPDKIAAVEVGANAYAQYSCSQLQAEELTITQDLANLSAAQQNAASNDALGVFLLGLPLSSMSGNDKEALIAVAKGKIQAIDRQQLARKCR